MKTLLLLLQLYNAHVATTDEQALVDSADRLCDSKNYDYLARPLGIKHTIKENIEISNCMAAWMDKNVASVDHVNRVITFKNGHRYVGGEATSVR